MSKWVFIDTGAFLALANGADPYHKTATERLKKLNTTRRALLTSNFVLDETYTRIRRTAGLDAAVLFGERLRESPTKIVTIEPALEKKAWDIFKRYSDQLFSYTDCTSFALMKQKKIREAFAFDRDFTIFGFQLVA